MKPRITFDSVNAFDKTIDFLIEVAVDDEISMTGRGREAIGGDGKTSKFTLNYILETLDLRFNWMSPDIYNKVFFWMQNYALGGDSFRYYPDQTDTTRYYECKLSRNDKSFDPKRAHPRVQEFDVKFNKVRVVATSAQVDTDRAAYYP